ncbi:MAG: metal ABC transporter ATP-binding protein [Pseudonocardia sp.]|nr:metal ABC transporter ATP-binding protein [Pseudonocardia sp.]
MGRDVARATDRTTERPAALSLRGAGLAFGPRTLWSGLDLDVAPGEFVAVLGPNGSGKTTLIRVLLGLLALSEGAVRVAGHTPRRGSPEIGYVPQQRPLDPDLPLRGRDLVGLGLDGHRFGIGLRGRADRRRRVCAALEAVDGTHYADAPVGRLSGGEQQRLRVAQALVGDPAVLLCDEPLLSLDLSHQRTVTRLIDERRRTTGTAVLFVTHEINPVLPLVDRVLYLVDGRFRIGPTEEVMTSEVLSELYRTDVDVLRVRDRLVVVGAEDGPVDLHPCHRPRGHDGDRAGPAVSS